MKESLLVNYEKFINQLQNAFIDTHIIKSQILNSAKEKKKYFNCTKSILKDNNSCYSSEDNNLVNEELSVSVNNIKSENHDNINIFSSACSSKIKYEIDNISSNQVKELDKSFQIQESYIKSNESESFLNRKRLLINEENENDIVNEVFNNFNEITQQIIKYKDKLEAVKSKFSIHYCNKKAKRLKEITNIVEVKSSNKRSKYLMVSSEQKKSIVEYSKVHGFKNTIKNFNISGKNLKRWINVGTERKKGGGRKVSDPIMDSKLLEWYNINYKSKELPISIKLLKQMAFEFSTVANFNGSKGWLYKFISKNDILIDKS
jgi:hypothetical protein